jgi:serpin B
MKPIKTMLSLIAAVSLSAGTLVGCGGSDANLPAVTPVSNPSFDKDAPTDLAVSSNNSLSVALYQQLNKQDKQIGNLFFSPMSVSAALMLTYEGARNQTKAEFEKVLSLEGADPLASHKAYAGVLGRLAAEDKPYKLAVANALWGEKTMPLRNEFLETVREHYAASFESVDFRHDFENQRKRINTWVSDRTKNRINDLLPEGALDDMTRLVLVNAIYFKSPWAIEFYEGMTKEMPFHVSNDKHVDVPMMRHSAEYFAYADFEGYDALQMQYKRGDLSMVVLLPDEKDGLSTLEAKLSATMIDRTIAGLKGEAVNVWLPKWETKQDYDLIPSLKGMGMTGAFDASTADFTGLTDSAAGERLKISGVFHKAFIAVDEEGTEAAAATAVVVAEESAALPPEKVYDFKCDHPFVYLIRDNRTGAILFMGRVTDPS